MITKHRAPLASLVISVGRNLRGINVIMSRLSGLRTGCVDVTGFLAGLQKAYNTQMLM